MLQEPVLIQTWGILAVRPGSAASRRRASQLEPAENLLDFAGTSFGARSAQDAADGPVRRADIFESGVIDVLAHAALARPHA